MMKMVRKIGVLKLVRVLRVVTLVRVVRVMGVKVLRVTYKFGWLDEMGGKKISGSRAYKQSSSA